MSLTIKTVRPADGEMLALLVATMLPLLSKDTFDIYSNPLGGGLVFLIFLICIYNSTATSFHFNPLLGMIGFHFYEITTHSGIPYTLITRKCIRSTDIETVVKEMSPYVYLDVKRS